MRVPKCSGEIKRLWPENGWISVRWDWCDIGMERVAATVANVSSSFRNFCTLNGVRITHDNTWYRLARKTPLLADNAANSKVEFIIVKMVDHRVDHLLVTQPALLWGYSAKYRQLRDGVQHRVNWLDWVVSTMCQTDSNNCLNSRKYHVATLSSYQNCWAAWHYDNTVLVHGFSHLNKWLAANVIMKFVYWCK
jgi:hypothetical protein